jgi:hypothetical protein
MNALQLDYKKWRVEKRRQNQLAKAETLWKHTVFGLEKALVI